MLCTLYYLNKYYCNRCFSYFPQKLRKKKIEQAMSLFLPYIKHFCVHWLFYSAVVWVGVLQQSSKPQKSTFKNYWVNVEMSLCIRITKPRLVYGRLIYVFSVVILAVCCFFFIKEQIKPENICILNNSSILEPVNWFWHHPIFI